MTTSVYEMKSAVVVADEANHELIFSFQPKDEDPAITLALPAGAVGHLVAQLVSAHQKISMKANDNAGVFIPLDITGARPFSTEEGDPILLLQFLNTFELATILDKENAANLAIVSASLLEPTGFAPPKRH